MKKEKTMDGEEEMKDSSKLAILSDDNSGDDIIPHKDEKSGLESVKTRLSTKKWQCPSCNSERVTDSDIKMKICYICQVEMEVCE